MGRWVNKFGGVSFTCIAFGHKQLSGGFTSISVPLGSIKVSSSGCLEQRFMPAPSENKLCQLYNLLLDTCNSRARLATVIVLWTSTSSSSEWDGGTSIPPHLRANGPNIILVHKLYCLVQCASILFCQLPVSCPLFDLPLPYCTSSTEIPVPCGQLSVTCSDSQAAV